MADGWRDDRPGRSKLCPPLHPDEAKTELSLSGSLLQRYLYALICITSSRWPAPRRVLLAAAHNTREEPMSEPWPSSALVSDNIPRMIERVACSDSLSTSDSRSLSSSSLFSLTFFGPYPPFAIGLGDHESQDCFGFTQW